MDIKRPGPKTVRSLLCGRPPPNDAEVYPIEFENMQRSAWRAGLLFCVPLEDDDEIFKPNRVAAELLVFLERHGFAAQEAPDVPRVSSYVVYETDEDRKKYTATDKGYTEFYNAYGWFEYQLPDQEYAPLLHTKDVETFRRAYFIANEALEGLPGFSGNTKDEVCWGREALSFSFIGQRRTPWDWADALVWSETASMEVRTKLHSSFWPLYDELDAIEERIEPQEMPESQLVHLNVAQYMESSDEGMVSGENLFGWFDPSTFFWRPLEYAKAMLVVDFLLGNIRMTMQDKHRVAEITIENALMARLTVLALRYRLLGTSRSMEEKGLEESSFTNRRQRFEYIFTALKPSLERHCSWGGGISEKGWMTG